MFGGIRTPLAAVVGGLIIGAICNIFHLLGVAAKQQLIMKGLLILLAVYPTSRHGAEVCQRIRQSMAARRTR